MVWSLSKDDDGLESVHPLTNQGASLPSPSDRVPAGRPKQPERPLNAVASVFVDPSSQVPDASTSFQKRQPVETTVVLKGRKLDELRAQVAQQKLSYQRKRQKTFIIWALAGGAALAMGWLAGVVLSPQDSGQLRDSPEAASRSTLEAAPALPSDEPVERPTNDPVDAAEEVPTKAEASDTPAPSANDTFTLDDLPAE